MLCSALFPHTYIPAGLQALLPTESSPQPHCHLYDPGHPTGVNRLVSYCGIGLHFNAD